MSGRLAGAFLGSDAPLFRAVRLDLDVHVATQVIGSIRALGSARLTEGRPRLVVDADYAATGSLRRHGHRVADRAPDGHLGAGGFPFGAPTVPLHPGVRSNQANAGNKPP